MSQWISVDDTLPPIGQVVLGFHNNWQMILPVTLWEDYYLKGTFYFTSESGGKFLIHEAWQGSSLHYRVILYWMPIGGLDTWPAPPQV